MSSSPPLTVLYQDEGMAIVDKPSGIAVHKGLDRSDDNVLKRLNRQLGTWVWPSHRLDRATSGALVFALHEEAASALARAFMEGRAKKTYLAWVRGAPDPREGVIDHPVPRSEGFGAKRRSPRPLVAGEREGASPSQAIEDCEERLEAVTAYRTVAIANDVRTGSPRYGLVLCEPRTGRYHQIRRHMRHVHCPILGDTTYGDNKENKALRAHGALHRLALHALALSVPHWRDPDRLVAVVAPVPADLRGPLATYGVGGETLEALEALVRAAPT